MTSDKRPVLSIVVTSRNDNHGGDLIYRMQLFIDGIIEQAQKFKENIELIIVEWNPPEEKPRLNKVLNFEKNNKYCNIIIIEVPTEIHNAYYYSDKFPLYQMIGKNVGIRRAHGKFILATNIDVLFSDELFEYMCSGKLDINKIYRTSRYDVKNEIPIEYNHLERLKYCESNIIRVNGRYSTESFITNEKYLLYPEYLESICNKYNLKEPVFTNACGDFHLLSKEQWFKLKGYPELDMFSIHIDSIFEYMAYYNKIEEIELKENMKMYHIEHTSGFQPENKELDDKLNEKKILSLNYNELLNISMMLKENKLVFNNDNWGLHGLNLTEFSVRNGYLNKVQDLLIYNPNVICNTTEIYNKIISYKNNYMLFNCTSFQEWIFKTILLNKIVYIEQLNDSKVLNFNLNNFDKNEILPIETALTKNKKIIIFGASSGFMNFVYPVIKHFKIKPSYIVDNDQDKVDKIVGGIEVKNVNNLILENKDNVLIIIASIFYKEIKRQLEDLGFQNNFNFISAFLYIDISTINTIESLMNEILNDD